MLGAYYSCARLNGHTVDISASNIFKDAQFVFSKFSGQFINILTQALYGTDADDFKGHHNVIYRLPTIETSLSNPWKLAVIFLQTILS
jgi:hypothetical protein